LCLQAIENHWFLHGKNSTKLVRHRSPRYCCHRQRDGIFRLASLNFLSDDVKHHLGFDASCPRLPLLLNSEASTSSDAAPNNLALIRFSYGLYWGILETQARMIAHKWSSDGHLMPQQDETRNNEKSKKIYTFMTELRTMMKEDPSAVAQNFFGDYPGLMEDCCRHLNLSTCSSDQKPELLALLGISTIDVTSRKQKRS
jgi:hypothetical protein